MTRQPHQTRRTLLAATKLTAIGILLQLSLSTFSLAHANSSDAVASSIDVPVVASTASSRKEQRKQLRMEQRALAKMERQQLRQLARKGERLAQVALGGNFASEAQLLTFAPDAANDALSDALAWYSLAAKRGYPGAPSLDSSGVNFYPVRVIRNK